MGWAHWFVHATAVARPVERAFVQRPEGAIPHNALRDPPPSPLHLFVERTELSFFGKEAPGRVGLCK